jgi:hypothetical protein
MHLQINQGKTKYMPVTKKIYTDDPTYLEISSYKFETFYSFVYLGLEVNYKNDISVDIQKRILSANRCFHGLRKHLKSHLISRKTKTLMYKVLVRPVLTYASETWTLLKTGDRLLSVFERRIFRCIFGTMQENGVWRKQYSHELYELINEPDIVKYIKVNILGWAGHVIHIDKNRTVKKVFNTKTIGRRKIARPKLRWEDDVIQDVKTLRVKNWRNVAMEKESWQKLLRKARAYVGLSSQ